MGRMEFHEDFKIPNAPHSPHGIRPQDFPIYAGGAPNYMLPGNSAFHRPLDPSGKPIPVSWFFLINFCVLFFLIYLGILSILEKYI